jgi:hypothetical protein
MFVRAAAFVDANFMHGMVLGISLTGITLFYSEETRQCFVLPSCVKLLQASTTTCPFATLMEIKIWWMD